MATFDVPGFSGLDRLRGATVLTVTSYDPIGPTVLWTRGRGCGELADAISGGRAVRVVGEMVEECVKHRARSIVTRRLSSFDLVSQVVPIGIDLPRVSTVVAAVAGGPHSHLAAVVAQRVGVALGVDAFMACAYRDDESKVQAVSVIEELYSLVPDLEYRLVEAPDAEGLISQLPTDSLLVLGAPGGSWLQRTFFGPGAKLRGQADAGTVVVMSAPRRVYQEMGDPVFVGPMRDAADILRLQTEPVLAVVDRARLVGVVRREALAQAGPGVMVGALMTEPMAVKLTDDLSDVADLGRFFAGAPVPVIDEDSHLVGSLSGDLTVTGTFDSGPGAEPAQQ